MKVKFHPVMQVTRVKMRGKSRQLHMAVVSAAVPLHPFAIGTIKHNIPIPLFRDVSMTMIYAGRKNVCNKPLSS